MTKYTNKSLLEAGIDDFPHQKTEIVRYSDTDRQGHVNNAVFSTFFECSRVSILYDESRALAEDGCEFVIVASEMQFLSEINWPGEVFIGTRIAHVGNSSIISEQAIYQHGKRAAISKNTMVMIDSINRKSRTFSEDIHQKIEDLRAY